MRESRKSATADLSPPLALIWCNKCRSPLKLQHLLLCLLRLSLESVWGIPESSENYLLQSHTHIPANANTQEMWHTSFLTVVKRVEQAVPVKKGNTRWMRRRTKETRGMSFQLGARVLRFDPLAGNFPSHPPQQHVTHQCIWIWLQKWLKLPAISWLKLCVCCLSPFVQCEGCFKSAVLFLGSFSAVASG